MPELVKFLLLAQYFNYSELVHTREWQPPAAEKRPGRRGKRRKGVKGP